MSNRIFLIFCFAFGSIVLAPLAAWAQESGSQTIDSSGYQLTIVTEPAEAKVTILNSTRAYSPGIRLPSGRYNILVSHPGYQEEKGYIEIQDKEWVGRVVLQPLEANDEQSRAAIDAEWKRINDEKAAIKEEKAEIKKSRNQLEMDQLELKKGRLELEKERQELEKKKKSLILQQLELAQVQFEIDAQRVEIAEKMNRLERMGKLSVKDGAANGGKAAKTPQPKMAVKAELQKEMAVEAVAQEKTVPVSSEEPQTSAKPRETIKKVAPIVAKAADYDLEKEVIKSPQKVVSVEDGTKTSGDSMSDKQFMDLVSSTPKGKTGNLELEALLETVLADLRAYQSKKKGAPKNPELQKNIDLLGKMAPDDKRVAKALRLFAKRYVVVVGIFSSQERAVKLEKRIAAIGLPAYHEPTVVRSGKTMYRVAVGLFENLAQAKEAEQRLLDGTKEKGFLIRSFVK